MNKYVGSVRINGQSVKAAVFADFQTHARPLPQYVYGFNNLASTPAQVNEAIAEVSKATKWGFSK